HREHGLQLVLLHEQLQRLLRRPEPDLLARPRLDAREVEARQLLDLLLRRVTEHDLRGAVEDARPAARTQGQSGARTPDRAAARRALPTAQKRVEWTCVDETDVDGTDGAETRAAVDALVDRMVQLPDVRQTPLALEGDDLDAGRLIGFHGQRAVLE